MREKIYESTGEPCTMFKLSSTCYLDGNRDSNGRPFGEGQNTGAIFNHSRNGANCKMMKADIDNAIRLFLITSTAVATGAELVYDYSDRRQGVPHWMFE